MGKNAIAYNILTETINSYIGIVPNDEEVKKECLDELTYGYYHTGILNYIQYSEVEQTLNSLFAV